MESKLSWLLLTLGNFWNNIHLGISLKDLNRFSGVLQHWNISLVQAPAKTIFKHVIYIFDDQFDYCYNILQLYSFSEICFHKNYKHAILNTSDLIFFTQIKLPIAYPTLIKIIIALIYIWWFNRFTNDYNDFMARTTLVLCFIIQKGE